MLNVQYRTLCAEEICRELFRDFIRHQIVTDCWRKEDGKWVIKKAPFVDDWTEKEYQILISCLKNTVLSGGLVCAAFCEAAERYGIIALPGMELTTAEEVHVVCVFGDLEIPETGKQTLEQLEYLNVQGDVRVQGGLEDLLARKLTVLKGKVQVIRGRYLKDKLFLRISREMLEQEPEGMTICDCVQVNLDHNIPGTLIQEKLQLDSCVKVHCTPEQEPAVSLVCQDVVQISTQSEGEESGIGGMVNHVLGTAGETADTRFVSAGDYVL